MIGPRYFIERYVETYEQITKNARRISHAESMVENVPGVNCLNWILGHIVVARCNFLMYLDKPSIWGKDKIMTYIPGSAPNLDMDEAVQFSQLLLDLGQTQEQLLGALEGVTLDDLRVIEGDRSVAEHLAFYHSHESLHAGQIEVISHILKSKRRS